MTAAEQAALSPVIWWKKAFKWQLFDSASLSGFKRVQHTLIFSRAIEVLMPERLEESRGLSVPGAGLLGGTFTLCFILCMSALPDPAVSSSTALCVFTLKH